MNLEFARINLDAAKNSDGTLVQGTSRERMGYYRGSFSLEFEVFVRHGVATLYQPVVSVGTLPDGLSLEDLYAEIRKGVAVATDSEVIWKS